MSIKKQIIVVKTNLQGLQDLEGFLLPITNYYLLTASFTTFPALLTVTRA